MTANKAYLKGLGLTPSALQQGLIAPLEASHFAVVTAARKLAQQAAIDRAEQQVGHHPVVWRLQQLLGRGRDSCLTRFPDPNSHAMQADMLLSSGFSCRRGSGYWMLGAATGASMKSSCAPPWTRWPLMRHEQHRR